MGVMLAGVGAVTISDARELWEPAGVYCNTASYGLPPRPAWEALQTALADWHGGRTSWEHWGQSTEEARAAFARLVGVGVERVAVGSTVSELVGSVVTALPARARVVAPDVEFTSMLFPLLVQERLEVRTVAPGRLVEAIGEGVDAVAFSAVQMSSGEVADLDAVVAAAASADAITICDATQAVGWLPLDAGRFDAVVCGAYKWLMSPRGSAFLTVSERLLEHALPHSAGWYAGEDVHASYFGPPLRLAVDARRFDLSPAWFSWVGTQPALEVIERIGVPAIHEHDVALANRFRAGLGLKPGNSDRLRRSTGCGRAAAARRDRCGAARGALAHVVARVQRCCGCRSGACRAGLTRMTSGGARRRWPLANGSRSLVDVPAELSFAIGSRDVGTVVTEIIPVIDGVALTDRVHRFERETGMESHAVSYGELIPACFRFGPAEVHYRAAAGAFVEEAKIPLLGCDCGEWAAGRCCAGWSSTPAPSRGATSSSPTVASATTRVLARSSSIATTTRRRSQR